MQRHDFDPIAFTFGVVFTGLGVLFMVGRLDVLSHAQWLWPGLLVLLGLAVLVGARGRGGARATRPAFESGSRIDPALEDDLLHSPMRTIDSEQLVDTSSLFTLGTRTPTRQAAGAGQPEEPRHTAERPERPEDEDSAEAARRPEDEDSAEAARRPEDTAVLPAVDPEAGREPEAGPASSGAVTEALPRVDRDADTQLLPQPRPKDEETDPQGERGE